jgi:hypothetical protein
MLHAPKKWLAAAALRFLRACIGLREDFYTRYIAKHDLLAEPLRVFLANGEKADLLNSTFLEMIEFIHTQVRCQMACFSGHASLDLALWSVLWAIAVRRDAVRHATHPKQVQHSFQLALALHRAVRSNPARQCWAHIAVAAFAPVWCSVLCCAILNGMVMILFLSPSCIMLLRWRNGRMHCSYLLAVFWLACTR